MKQPKLPKGWSLQKVKRVAAFYDAQSEEDAAREIEDASRVAVKVPQKLLPKLRNLLAKSNVEVEAEDLHKQREQRVGVLLATLTDSVVPDLESRRHKLKTAISRKLSRDQRMTVILYYFHEFSFAQIADLLGTPCREVRAMHRSALNQLRAVL